MRRHKNLIAFTLTVVATILVDQLSKLWIISTLAPGQTFRLLPGLDITHVKNSGAAFGLFSRYSPVIFWVSLVVVAVALVWLLKSPSAKRMGMPVYVAVGLITGGALANNLIDRVFRGTVVDYIDVHWWPVFNFADVAIVVGVIIVVLSVFVSMRSGAQDKEAQGG